MGRHERPLSLPEDMGYVAVASRPVGDLELLDDPLFRLGVYVGSSRDCTNVPDT